MKYLVLLLCILSTCTVLLAYQNNALSLYTPTTLYEDQAEINLGHRFYGAVDEDILDTFFGMDSGANVRLAYRQNLIYNIELKTAYERQRNRYEIGSSFRFTPFENAVQSQIDLIYSSFKQSGQKNRRNNFVYLISAQNKAWRDRFVITANAGFDAYYERLISGIGIHIILADKLTLIGEYYPVWDRDSASDRIKQYLGSNDSYGIGLKIDTYGHHFIFMVGNSDALGPSGLSMGTNNSDLRFGFNIQRFMQF